MTDAELLAKSTDLLDRLRAAQLDPQTLRHGWLAEAAGEIATLRRKLALAQEECRTAWLYIKRSAESAATGYDSGNLTSIASQCYMAARAANQMDAPMAKAWTIGTDTSLSISRKDTP